MGHDAVDQEHRGLCDGVTTSIDPFSNCLVPVVKKDFTEHSVRANFFADKILPILRGLTSYLRQCTRQDEIILMRVFLEYRNF